MTKEHDPQLRRKEHDRTSRAGRFARYLGNKATGAHAAIVRARDRAYDKEDQRVESKRLAQFESAIAMARGLNRQALEIKKAAISLPNQELSSPLQEVRVIAPQSGERTWAWLTSLRSAKEKYRDKDDRHLPVSPDLGSLSIDGRKLPVSDLTISSYPVDDEGKLTPASTKVTIKTAKTEQDFEQPTKPYIGEVGITIGPDGQISGLTKLVKFYSDTPNRVNMHVADTDIDLEGFFSGVLVAVNETAKASVAPTS